jgi:hypothetical protein
MTTQQSLFPDAPLIVDPEVHLPLVVCGGNIPGRGCGRYMFWATSGNGKAVPLDPDPVPDGNLVFVDSPDRATVRYLHKGETVSEGAARYKSHFATCEKARDFRRR